MLFSSIIAKSRSWPAASFIVKAVAFICRRYLEAYNNEHRVDMRFNGETWLISRVRDISGGQKLVFLDVGANTGKWTETVLSLCPSADVVAFEMIPSFRELLQDRLKDHTSVTIVDCGLSDADKTIKAFQMAGGGAIVPRPSSRKVPIPTEVHLRPGDSVLDDLEIKRVHFIKIDTEGHELSVLRGLEKTIARDRPIIQFEYSEFTMLQRVYLRDIYEFLEPKGYVVGKLLPSAIALGPYDKRDENFVTKNFAAVPKGQNQAKLAARMART